MNSLETLQTDFLSAIYGAPNLQGLKAGFTDNLDIYRNNLVLGLYENLSGKFPIVLELLGSEFFENTAAQFIKFEPLNQGHNNDFGAKLSLFLEGFLESDFKFVAKIAEIEWAKFVAESQSQLNKVGFAEIANALQIGNMNIELNPSLSLIHADFNAFELYFAHLNGDIDGFQFKTVPQNIAIWANEEFEPCFKVLDKFESDFLATMKMGISIIEALENTIQNHGQNEENQAKFVALCDLGLLKI